MWDFKISKCVYLKGYTLNDKSGEIISLGSGQFKNSVLA